MTLETGNWKKKKLETGKSGYRMQETRCRMRDTGKEKRWKRTKPTGRSRGKAPLRQAPFGKLRIFDRIYVRTSNVPFGKLPPAS